MKLWNVLIAAALTLSACKKDNGTGDEADTDTDTDTDSDTDTDTDADTDTDTDADADADADPDVAVIETCSNTIPTPPAGELCAVSGDPDTATHLLIEGDVLGDTVAYEAGQVLVALGDNGLIECVGCDCESSAPAELLTVSCAEGVVSPGLINAHDHIRYNLMSPGDHGDERYDHRHDWRTGARDNHTELNSFSDNSREGLLYGEIRMMLGGATSIAGSISSVDASGLMRNLDRAQYNEGLGGWEVGYETFPLSDQDGTLAASGCQNYSPDPDFVLEDRIYLPHIAEGIDLEANNEFQCLSGAATGSVDLIEDNTSIVHGIGLLPTDVAEVSDNGAHLVWSPRSNISLYGETAPVRLYRAMGVPIALGTDWTPSGSATMLRELKCADSLNTDHYDSAFSDRELWLMATRSAAVAMGAESQLGSLRPGLVADIAIFDGTQADLHRAVIEAEIDDVELVLRGSKPLTGDRDLLDGLLGDTQSCETLASCVSDHAICVSEDAGITLASIESSVGGGAYDLYICDEPSDEPSCEPFRDNESNDGLVYPTSSTTDFDGDGVDNADDNCPDVFNPGKPLDGFVQGDADGDGAGDVCDRCPLEAGLVTCSWRDGDLDGVMDLDDNCPGVDNANQDDGDGDFIGDACDPCPTFASADGACPETVYDIKTGAVSVGSEVALQGMLVTASNEDGVFLQLEPGQPGYISEDHSGIYAFMRTIEPKPQRGDRVDLFGSVSEFFGQIQIADVTGFTVLSTGNADPAPIVVDPADVATGGTRADALEGVVIAVEDVEVTELEPMPGPGDMAPNNEFVVDGSLRVNDEFHLVAPFPSVGENFATLSGVLRFGNANSRLEPRDSDDALAGAPSLASLAPAQVFLEAGDTTDALLAVGLTRPAGAATDVTLDCAPAATLTCPATVTIGVGEQFAGVELTGVAASSMAATVTATLGADTETADVFVYDDATVREIVAIDPASLPVRTGATEQLTITLNVPAATGGTTVMLSAGPLVTVPASVTVPEDAVSITFDVTAGATEGTETLTATLGASVETATIEVSEGVVGDGPIFTRYLEGSSGNNKFVEVTNLSPTDVDLGTCQVRLYTNGATSPGNTIDLDSVMLAQGVPFVLCHSSADFPTGVAGGGCDQEAGSLTFNGDDAVELFCDGATLDIIGKIGEDPGSAWEVGGVSTQDSGLVRNCDITEGDTDGSDDFDPSAQWTATPGNDASGFGTERACP